MATGIAAARANRTADAIRSFESAQRLNGYSRDMLYNLSRVYLVDSAASKALPLIERLLEVDPSNPDDYQLAAIAHALLYRQLKGRAAADPDYAADLGDSLKWHLAAAVKYGDMTTKLVATVVFSVFDADDERATATASVTNSSKDARTFTLTIGFLDRSGAVIATRVLPTARLGNGSSEELSAIVNGVGIVAFKYTIR